MREDLRTADRCDSAGLEYRGVVFTFRADNGGTMGLLRVREDGKWKIASYQSFSQ